ncbi:MAG: hypothetical protein Q8N47_26110, partial [Bryobacterales bacterium]|nr:hypothetical protein [Bryobacterales bacterium]
MPFTTRLSRLLRYLTWSACTVVLAAATAAGAQTPPSAAGQVPLIDRELFFGNPEISSATLS